jgi:hypothetical protein
VAFDFTEADAAERYALDGEWIVLALEMQYPAPLFPAEDQAQLLDVDVDSRSGFCFIESCWVIFFSLAQAHPRQTTTAAGSSR